MADKFKHLMPAPGMPQTMDPVTMGLLAVAGEWKPWTGPEGRYWRRRVADGSVIESSPVRETAAVTPLRKAEKPAPRGGGGDQ